jgi:hypothetical protein
MLRSLRFCSTLDFDLDEEMSDFIKERGELKFKNYQRKKRVCMDMMNLVSNDYCWTDAVEFFLEHRLVHGLYDKMVLKSKETLYTEEFKEKIMSKIKLFSLLEKFLHSINYEKRSHYWMIKNMKRPMRLFML